MIAAVLAAGMATRYGSCKAIADIEGTSMLRRVLAALPKQLPTIVVTGAYRKLVEDHVADTSDAPTSLTCVFNPDYQEGIAASLRVAAAWAAAWAAAQKPADEPLLLTLADLPFLSATDYQRLLSAYALAPDTSVFAGFQDTHGTATFGPPAIFAPADRRRLLELKGDKGAKALFNTPPPTVAIPAAARDIDCPEQ